MNEPGFEVSGGNIFADLGFTEPEEELARAALAHRIATIVEDRGLTPGAAAKLMGSDPREVAALVRGHLEGFSLERLARYLIALGNDVDIVVYPASETGHLRVRAAPCQPLQSAPYLARPYPPHASGALRYVNQRCGCWRVLLAVPSK